MLELYAGSGNMAAAFRKAGYQTLTVDMHEQADVQVDVRELTPEKIIELLGGRPDVIWASPPCTAFSVAAISRNWDNGIAKSPKAHLGVELLAHTLRLIMQLKPAKWYIENPRGMMRKLPVMAYLPRKTLTFCQYGDRAQKPTDVWTNVPLFCPLSCSPGSPCHDAQPRGYRAKKDTGAVKKGTQGKSGAKERGTLPTALCEYVASL